MAKTTKRTGAAGAVRDPATLPYPRYPGCPDLGYITTADMIYAEGYAQAKLLGLLRAEFKTVPADIVAAVNGGSLPDLETWMDRVLTAGTLDQVFDSRINDRNSDSGRRNGGRGSPGPAAED